MLRTLMSTTTMMASSAKRIVTTSRGCYSTARQLSSSAVASAAASPAEFQQLLPTSSHGLGLESHWIRLHWESIRQLPEIPRALSTFDSISGSDSTGAATSHDPLGDMSRAENVFRSLSEGGGEHRATLALLAELQQRWGSYHACHGTLQRLQSYNVADDATHGGSEHVSMSLARAKALWYMGDAQSTVSICDDLLDLNDGPVGLTSLQEASARTGQALGWLLRSSETLDDVFTLRDPFRMVVKALERALPASIPLALAHLNYGVAEAYYAHVIEQNNGVVAPIDAALRSWKQGLTIVQRPPSKNAFDPAVARSLEARLLTNMAWGLLKAKNVDQASEYAGRALKLYDQVDGVPWTKEGMGRTLSLVATCYHKSSSAVTSEGLFQSAVDDSRLRAWAKSSPLYQLELADSYARFADLCREWDRREGDTKRLEDQASQLRTALPPAWQAKPSVCGSLWFWTPSLH